MVASKKGLLHNICENQGNTLYVYIMCYIILLIYFLIRSDVQSRGYKVSSVLALLIDLSCLRLYGWRPIDLGYTTFLVDIL